MITFSIPMKTPSVANIRQHWASRARLVAKQRRDTRLLCPPWTAGPLLVVRITRVSPRQLDSHDNLRAACKAVVDGIATWLRIDDASPLVRWEYGQERGEECVRVEVQQL